MEHPARRVLKEVLMPDAHVLVGEPRHLRDSALLVLFFNREIISIRELFLAQVDFNPDRERCFLNVCFFSLSAVVEEEGSVLAAEQVFCEEKQKFCVEFKQ